MEDVRDVSTKERFDRFLKRSGLFTKPAREHLAKFLPKQSDSDSKDFDIVTNFTEKLKELNNSFRN